MPLSLAKIAAPSLLLAASLASPGVARAQDGTPFPSQPTYAPLEGPAPAPSPEPPNAPEPMPRFGEAGQVVVTGATGLGLSSLQYSTSEASVFGASANLSFDVFVIRHLSVGLDLEGSYSDSRGYGADSSLVETKASLVSGGPRFGVNLPLSERFSFYPRVVLGVHWTHQDVSIVHGSSASIAASPIGSPSMSRSGPWLDLYLPLDWQVAPHFFVGAGPRIYHDFARAQGGPDVGGERTQIGGDLEVGGFWGGAATEEAAPASSEPARRERRFGDGGTLVIANDFVVGGSSTSYSGTQAAFSTITIAPGFDYFPSDRVSIGFAGSYGGSSTTGFEPDGTRVESTITSFGVSARFGVDVPLASRLSLYPRVGLGFGSKTYDETGGGKESKYTSTDTWVTASIPLLVHVVPHFFVGFGPYATTDLTQSYDVGAPENKATRIGASALVGGWL